MIFSLRSKILNQNDYRKSAEEEIPKCKDELIIISAYIKNQGLLWLKKFVSKDVKVKVICRWSENDLLQGSSDLEIYEFCKENNWNFKILNNLHAKVICLDRKKLFIGSQNLTSRGLSLFNSSNEEIGVLTNVTNEELDVIDNINNNSIEINDEIYGMYKKWLDQNIKNFKKIEFSDEIKIITNLDLDNLWVKDLPSSDYNFFINNIKKNIDEIIHTKEVFSIFEDGFDNKNLERKIINSKIFKWIKKKLTEENLNSINFGKLSNLIHNSVKDDPTPYRLTIKNLQNNLYSFLREINSDQFKIEIPGERSEVLTIYDK